MVPLTGTTDARHMQADLDIFSFALDPAEIEKIASLAAP
jgi:diketogulonate reductase-like aldo/keto reductase